MNDLEPISHAYLRSDLRNSLKAIAIASRGGRRSAEYAAGFADAIDAMCAAMGIEPPARIVEPQTIDATQDWPPVGWPPAPAGRFRVVGSNE